MELPKLNRCREGELSEEDPRDIWKNFDDLDSEDTHYAGRAKKYFRSMWSGNEALMANDNEYEKAFSDGSWACSAAAPLARMAAQPSSNLNPAPPKEAPKQEGRGKVGQKVRKHNRKGRESSQGSPERTHYAPGTEAPGGRQPRSKMQQQDDKSGKA